MKTKTLKSNVTLRFRKEHAHYFLKFAIKKSLKPVITKESQSGEVFYIVCFDVKSKQDAFEIGAGWHFFMSGEQSMNSFEEFIYMNKVETLENEGSLIL